MSDLDFIREEGTYHLEGICHPVSSNYDRWQVVNQISDPSKLIKYAYKYTSFDGSIYETNMRPKWSQEKLSIVSDPHSKSVKLFTPNGWVEPKINNYRSWACSTGYDI